VSPAYGSASGERYGQQDDYRAIELVESETSELNTRTGEINMQTGNDWAPAQHLDMDNEPASETSAPASDTGRDEPAISDLLAVAEEFNAAFNTALYELEASRKLAKERSDRIEELNESIVSIKTALQEETSANQRKDEAHTRESEALNQSLRELESERERLRQLINEQQQSLDAQAGEIADLTSRVMELTETLEQHKVDSSRAAEAFAREREESNSAREALAARLTGHEALEQEVAYLREIVSHAGGKLEAPPLPNADVMSLQDEIERPGPILSASAEDCGQLQVGRPETSRQPLPGATPSQPQNTDTAPEITDRDVFISHLDTLLAEISGSGARHILMYVLLDNFIRVRDEIGDMNSEQVVDGIAGIIGLQCGSNDMMTRYGECTFAVLCSGATTDDTKKKAERIRSTVEKAVFEVAGRTLVTSISIGICAVRGSDSDAGQVISRASLACESVRLTGGNQALAISAVSDTLAVTGSNASHAEIVDRVLVENRIRIHYQPITNLKDNTVNCFEVLTRIVDENNDIILPGDFLSMAVTSGKAREVDYHVIESSMRMLADNTNPNIKLFIKLTRQSVSCHDFPLWIMSKSKQYKINPGRLVFEVTERAMKSEYENLSMLSKALDKIGCRIAIVDYRLEIQTQLLEHINADYLKIDSKLVQNICSKGRSLAKVTGIMEVARNYNLTTIAESVENPQCLAVLRELDVNLAQGYFISGPAGNAIFESHDGDAADAVANNGKASFTLG
jgi:diguanylate cyclase (GGDEF)-like protein